MQAGGPSPNFFQPSQTLLSVPACPSSACPQILCPPHKAPSFLQPLASPSSGALPVSSRDFPLVPLPLAVAQNTWCDLPSSQLSRKPLNEKESAKLQQEKKLNSVMVIGVHNLRNNCLLYEFVSACASSGALPVGYDPWTCSGPCPPRWADVAPPPIPNRARGENRMGKKITFLFF